MSCNLHNPEVISLVFDLKTKRVGSIIAPSSLVTRDGRPTPALTPSEKTLIKEVVQKATELRIVELVYSEDGRIWTTDRSTVEHLNPDEFRIALRRR